MTSFSDDVYIYGGRSSSGNNLYALNDVWRFNEPSRVLFMLIKIVLASTVVLRIYIFRAGQGYKRGAYLVVILFL